MEEARTELAEQGYDNLTIRQIAARCNIAVGTVYNYFKSKDVILGALLGEDWHSVLSDMDASIPKSKSLHEGLCMVASGLEGFCDRYRRLWSEYRRTDSSQYYSQNGHQMLLHAMVPRVEDILARNGRPMEAGLSELICETMISLASHGKHYAERANIIERMIPDR
ncbi:MAG: TetR/AcrR family transcriptional regulator; helix-turn-helix transcriptional regulator [Bacteroidales bacterium]|nr:TetR/AcrR family transcriptional regulator; helix-turn-helix transcriptional regulator [Bacteroidales bacterium]